MFPIIYHDVYNFSFWGLEGFHSFEADKFRKIKTKLLISDKFSEDDFIRPDLREKDIESYLSDSYIKDLKKSRYICDVIELWPLKFLPMFVVKKKINLPKLYATSGTVLAAELALENGIAVNLGGGFHHASFYKGHGFCLYPDVPIAIQEIRIRFGINRFLIIDLDAHQGDGTAHSIGNDPNILMIDAFDKTATFPLDQEAKNYRNIIPIELDPLEMNDMQYIRMIEKRILPHVHAFRPDMIFYNAGTDVYEHDPKSGLQLTKNGILERERRIFSMARLNSIPLVMVLSGGYHQDSSEIVAQSVYNEFCK